MIFGYSEYVNCFDIVGFCVKFIATRYQYLFIVYSLSYSFIFFSKSEIFFFTMEYRTIILQYCVLPCFYSPSLECYQLEYYLPDTRNPSSPWCWSPSGSICSPSCSRIRRSCGRTPHARPRRQNCWKKDIRCRTCAEKTIKFSFALINFVISKSS